jgi:purine-binding chemotaxis protein CheW
MSQYATFFLGDRMFGLPILVVREIIRSCDITPVPLVPAHVRGLINLRGQVVTIMDLGVRLGIQGRAADAGSNVVILSPEGDAASQGQASGAEDLAGFLVDAVGDVVEADPSSMEPAPANVLDSSGHFIQCVAKTDAGLMVLLDLPAVLARTSAA